MNIIPCFSTPICTDFIDYDFNQSYFDELKYFEYHNKTGFSSVNENILLEEQFLNVRQQIESKLNSYLFDFLKFSQGKIKHSLSWVNLHKPGNFSQQHCHTNSFYSGILYLKYPENSGELYFHHPPQLPTYCSTTIFPTVTENNIYNSKNVPIFPKDNMVVFFPSHLDHSTGINNSKFNRYSIAFNYFIEGEIGTITGKVSLSSN